MSVLGYLSLSSLTFFSYVLLSLILSPQTNANIPDMIPRRRIITTPIPIASSSTSPINLASSSPLPNSDSPTPQTEHSNVVTSQLPHTPATTSPLPTETPECPRDFASIIIPALDLIYDGGVRRLAMREKEQFRILSQVHVSCRIDDGH
jgi:hypothetical protein